VDSNKPPLHRSLKDIPAVEMGPPKDKMKGPGGALQAQMVFGSDTSIMIAERETGYHSKPHYHDAEQMNYIMSGAIWFFIDGHGFHAKEGDIVRVPRNAVHWAWVRDPGGCLMFESHTPPLTGDEKMKNGAVSMLSAAEPPAAAGVCNLWADVSDDEMEAIERRAVIE
jgi:quercetin dioxygenase-like cupin family protein